MDAKLLVVGGKASKGSISLKLPTVIGRSREATLTIAHPMISRRHCEVYEADGLLMVRDLGSLNGTVIGGQRIKEAPLPPDGEFSIGPLTFRAQYQYAGELDGLPAPVLAERKAAAAADGAWTDSPDFQVARRLRPLRSAERRGRAAAPRRKRPSQGWSSRPRRSHSRSRPPYAAPEKGKKSRLAGLMQGHEEGEAIAAGRGGEGPSSRFRGPSAAATRPPTMPRRKRPAGPGRKGEARRATGNHRVPRRRSLRRRPYLASEPDEGPSDDPFDAFLNELGSGLLRAERKLTGHGN